MAYSKERYEKYKPVILKAIKKYVSTEKGKDTIRKRRKKVVKERRVSGLCTRCGKFRSVTNRVMCEQCRSYYRKVTA